MILSTMSTISLKAGVKILERTLEYNKSTPVIGIIIFIIIHEADI